MHKYSSIVLSANLIKSKIHNLGVVFWSVPNTVFRLQTQINIKDKYFYIKVDIFFDYTYPMNIGI